MAVRQIITFENPRLRKKSIKIKRVDTDLQTLIDDMFDTMRAAEGIGLAAPQVGVLLRLIVLEYTEEDSDELVTMALINPEITERWGEWLAEEGCLSIPGYTGIVPRSERVTVKAKDRHGKDVKIKADGVLAHVLQHETDHLDGVLYIDYITDPDDLKPADPARKRRRRRGTAASESESPSGDAAATGGAAGEIDEEPKRAPCCDICGHI